MAVRSVVIVLPGLAGSELFLQDEIIWPGDGQDISSYPEEKLQILINKPLVPRDIVRSVLGIPVYQSLIDLLETLGYEEAPSKGPPSLIAFPYDWRQDLTLTAGKLADCIIQIFSAFGGACAITILAHSTGGLVARCLLESGEFDDVLGDARSSISQLILIGTAGAGVPYVLSGIVGIDGFLMLTPAQAARLAAAPKYPAAYQHLPAPGTKVVWDARARGQSVDIYTSKVSANLGFDSKHLDSAISFWSKLALPFPPENSPSYFAFVGTRQNTLTGFIYDSSSSGGAALSPQSSDCGGDNTVPIWSSDRPDLLARYVGGTHAFLFDDPRVVTTLLDMIPHISKSSTKVANINKRIAAAIDVSTPSLILRADSVNLEGPAKVVLNLHAGPSSLLVGEIVIERRPISARASKIGGNDLTQGKFETVARLQLDLPIPPPSVYPLTVGTVSDYPAGQYRAYFLKKGDEEAAGRSANFVIQETRARDA
jgi:hypothetical protein